MKRSPLRRKTPLRARVGLKRTEWKRKRKSESSTLRKTRVIVKERSGGICEAPWCRQPATDMHHIVLRSRGGSDEPYNIVHLCHETHMWAHQNPDKATEAGLMRRAGEVDSDDLP